ncbi:MAG TPA: DUF3891 family protein [Solirubrobacteraceae bacterium]|nr:DUF3891 family protein [Solirubrobacteraceae bacterium]
MVLRDDGDGVIAIGQPAHAWVSGQLARAWGNERFGRVAPRDDVCLAAVQHDIGMAAWDAAPELNAETGLPQSFLEMPVHRHLELWSRAPALAGTQSRYAALLVSCHGTTLYEMRDLQREPSNIAAAIGEYLAAQRELQARLRDSLAGDAEYGPYAGEAGIERNRRLLFTWDGISLALCMRSFPWTVRDVPVAGEASVEVRVTGEGLRAHVDPWPFEAAQLTVHCDGRRLDERFDDEASMRAALDRAPWRTLVFELEPAPPG